MEVHFTLDEISLVEFSLGGGGYVSKMMSQIYRYYLNNDQKLNTKETTFLLKVRSNDSKRTEIII